MAIRWIVSAWNNNVKGSKLAICFKKTSVLNWSTKKKLINESQEEDKQWGEDMTYDEDGDIEVEEDDMG
jgi:hypothetical protein